MKITAVADKRIFCLYAALNAVGYDLENKPPMHPVRVAVREYLAGLSLDLTDLHDLFTKYESNHYYSLRTWILCHGEPPEFPEINADWKLKVPEEIDILNSLLSDFWAKGKLEIIWERVLPEYQKAVIDLEKLGREAVDKIVSYLKTDALGIEEFVIVPNFLESHSLGIGPTIGQTAFAILGPQSTDRFSLSRVMHEFLHSVINPLTEHLPDTKQRSKLREYWIRAIVMQATGLDANKHTKTKQMLIDNGYSDIDDYLNKLAEFEKGSVDFLTYFSTLPRE